MDDIPLCFHTIIHCSHIKSLTHLNKYSSSRHLIMSRHNPLFLVNHVLVLVSLNFFAEAVMNLVCFPGLHIGLKHQVNVFKRPSSSLWVEEEHMERHHCAEYTEDDIGLPLNVGESRCHKVRQREVEDPVTRSRETDTLCTVLEREDFRSVDPRHGGLH